MKQYLYACIPLTNAWNFGTEWIGQNYHTVTLDYYNIQVSGTSIANIHIQCNTIHSKATIGQSDKSNLWFDYMNQGHIKLPNFLIQ